MAESKLQNRPDSVGIVEVGGYECTVTLSSSGDFYLHYGNKIVGRSDTLDKAKKAARRELNKRKVKIEILFLDNQWRERRTTGLHQGMIDKAIVLGNRQTEYMNGYARVWDPAIPAEERVRYNTAQAEIRERNKILKKIEEKYSFQLIERIRAAERAALDALDQMEGE